MDRVIQKRSRFGREIPVGGSYIGATDIPGSGSRPLYHQSVNITANTTAGKKTIGFPARNQKNFVTGPGS